MTKAELVVATAKSFLGVKEVPPNSNNVMFNTDYYGKPVSGAAYPWCMTFVWDVFRLAGLSKLFFGGDKTASCSALMEWAKKGGTWVTKDYQPGDVIIMEFGKGQRHVGICCTSGVTTIRTYEGNTSVTSNDNGGSVMERTRNLSAILGAYRPPYEDTNTKEDEDMTITPEQFDGLMNAWLRAQAKKGVDPNIAPEEFEAAQLAGVTDGSRPQAFATRQEVAVMAARAAKGVSR